MHSTLQLASVGVVGLDTLGCKYLHPILYLAAQPLECEIVYGICEMMTAVSQVMDLGVCLTVATAEIRPCRLSWVRHDMARRAERLNGREEFSIILP
jgi:hypothetical protein